MATTTATTSTNIHNNNNNTNQQQQQQQQQQHHNHQNHHCQPSSSISSPIPIPINHQNQQQRLRHQSTSASASTPTISTPPSTSTSSTNPSNHPQHPQPQQTQAVDFDEGVLRTLCSLECGLPLLLDRLKQAVGTSREVSTFLKKKSLLEEEYSNKLLKLTRERLDSYNNLGGELKSGSFSRQFVSFLNAHERMAIERNDHSIKLNSIGDELMGMSKEIERIRKVNKDLGFKLEKSLGESESQTEKAKVKFETTAEELEKVLMSRNGEQTAPVQSAQTKVLGKAISKLTTKASRTANQIARMEEDMRHKMSQVSDVYRSQVIATQQVRQEYFHLQLPRILRTLKEHSDEVDLAIQYYLTNYATLSESLLINEALSVSSAPSDPTPSSLPSPSKGSRSSLTPTGPLPMTSSNQSQHPNGQQPQNKCFGGLKDLIQEIDNRADFKEYMANYAAHFNQTHHNQINQIHANASHHHQLYNYQSGIGNPSQVSLATTNHLPPPAGMLPVLRSSLGNPSPRTSISSTVVTQFDQAKKTFGVDLATQMNRDGIENVPKILEKSVELIEKAGGLEMVGIYRLSGTTSKIAKLKQRFDLDADNFKMEINEENFNEINDLTGVLKLWLRELPEPLLTWKLYSGFIEAARIENDRLRHIRLHERVNELPDPNYATLKFLMGHLDRVRMHESENSMGASNLAVIFGPTLLSAPPQSNQTSSNTGSLPRKLSSPLNYSSNSNHQLSSTTSSASSNNNIGNPNSLHPQNPINNNGISNGSGENLSGVGSSTHSFLQDMSAQCKAIETILVHYKEIFIEDDEEEEEEVEEATGAVGVGVKPREREESLGERSSSEKEKSKDVVGGLVGSGRGSVGSGGQLKLDSNQHHHQNNNSNEINEISNNSNSNSSSNNHFNHHHHPSSLSN